MARPHHGSSNYQGPGIYKHYKGGKYEVLGIAVKEDSIDKERAANGEVSGLVMVIYRSLDRGSLLPKLTVMDKKNSAEVGLWAREISDFNAKIQLDHNYFVSRFSKYGVIRSKIHRRLVKATKKTEDASI